MSEGSWGRRLPTGCIEPFLNAAQLGGGDAVSLAELAGLHAAGTDALSAAQAYGTLVASGRRAQLRDVLAVTLPSGPSGSSSASGSPSRVVGAGPPRPHDRSGSGPADVDSPSQRRPGGGVNSSRSWPGSRPRCSWVARCRCAWPCRPAPGRLRRRLSPARRRQSSPSSGPEYLGRAGERAVPPTLSPPAPVTVSPSSPPPHQGSGGSGGSQSAVPPDHVPRGVVDQHSFARVHPARSDPLGAAGHRQGPAARRHADAGTAHRPADEPASSGPPALAVFLGSAAHAVCFPTRGRVVVPDRPSERPAVHA